jgi:sugar-specific transcriptional regulator TrmB
MITEILEIIGLTKSEIKVYLALLELGSSTTGPLVEKSHASSSKIYEILEKLIQKGLASFVIEAGTKYFEAAPPSRLLDYMKEKEDLLAKQRQELQHIIPALELKQHYSKNRSEATIFRGLKGVKTAY